MYTVEFNNVSYTAANGDYDYFELNPAADIPIRLAGLFLGQETNESDANEDFSRIVILRFTGATLTSGSGGSAPTPRPVSNGDAAAGFAAETSNSTVATTSGTSVRLHSDTFNIRTGYQMWWPPEARVTCPGSTDAVLIIRQESTLDANSTFSGTAYIEEMV
jgi:hypothetical protein